MTAKRIAFVGTAGSGKTTLAYDINVALKKKGINSEIVPEYIRDYLNKYGPMQSVFEQYKVFEEQTKREDRLPENVEYIITDSIRGLGYFYTALYHDKESNRDHLVLSDMYKYLLDDLYSRRYTHIFFLPKEKSYAANSKILSDGTRYQSLAEVDALEAHMKLMFCHVHSLSNIHILSCDLKERVDEVLRIINVE